VELGPPVQPRPSQGGRRDTARTVTPVARGSSSDVIRLDQAHRLPRCAGGSVHRGFSSSGFRRAEEWSPPRKVDQQGRRREDFNDERCETCYEQSNTRNLPFAAIRGSGRPHLLPDGLCRIVSTGRRARGQDSEGCEASRKRSDWQSRNRSCCARIRWSS